MSRVFDGSPASEGIGSACVRRVDWSIPLVPHEMVAQEDVDAEVERFAQARSMVRSRLEELKALTEGRLGPVEARIFDPQILMLEDVEVVDGTVRYIRENRLTAARAFDWRMMELQNLWRRTNHPMVLDRLNDLEDLQVRLLNRLLGRDDPFRVDPGEGPLVLVARNVTPSMTVQLDPNQIAGIATDRGTRTSHWAILARSQKIPAVVGLGDFFRHATEGQEAIVDGRIGRVILDPTDADRQVFSARKERIRLWEAEVEAIAELESVTADDHPVALRANLDLPMEAPNALRHGAEGVGLLRTEFLVVGRNAMPEEDEQYEGYRRVAETFKGHPVYIRLFDLGGDKFPVFLHMPAEENPFLGWRAVRVLLDRPELFRTQLRAVLRATAHGDVRIMVPLVNDVEEIRRVRALLEAAEEELRREGIPYNSGYKVGVMVETPAAALDAVELARHSDFFSIGTNDLVQYTLAVDRTNARLAKLFNPFHPAVVRQLHSVSRVARAAGIEVSVCGEMAATALGAFLLLGLDISTLSVAWPAIPEIKKILRECRVEDARVAARRALAAPTARDVTECLAEALGSTVDLAAYRGRWDLEVPPR
ncbi:MAG TPA: phosphoenolpyruvate--protein phosphotransferase [Longimicrobiales bacterium]|nr:phosphoenolpyruvate--protein phosphotransferase [Longimicrobiales bacterium]